MLFPTVEFALFFAVVLALNWLLWDWPQARRLLLLSASLLFYGFRDIRYLALLGLISLSAYVAARAIERARRPKPRAAWAAAGISANLFVLATFKYYDFFRDMAGNVLAAAQVDARLPVLELILPVGISFYTFQSLAYIIDVYRERLTAERSIFNVLLYHSFFPTVTSGPIIRPGAFLDQVKTRGPREICDPHRAFSLLLGGLFKKLVLSSYLSTYVVNPVFAVPLNHSPAEVLLAIYGYAAQIYCDFSGYTDMAIGIAALLGVALPPNFDRPYLAVNVAEFWRRWHMTLTLWLRDYLLAPLFRGKRTKWKTMRNTLITMGLAGLWHGASWNFVLWGLIHGLGIVATQRYQRWKIRRGKIGGSLLRRVLATVVTFHFVCLMWILFRAETLTSAWQMFQSLFRWTPRGEPIAALAIAVVCAGLLGQTIGGWGRRVYFQLQSRLPLPLQGLVIGLVLIIIIALGPRIVPPFIYFQF